MNENVNILKFKVFYCVESLFKYYWSQYHLESWLTTPM